ncbi:MAG: hypothetical protein QOH62_760 [Solirubrobacteraceae bacterium]|jgi:hypothetical protein|nr:hypothetical protein [Solirubrobacteraceae bacterium]
MHATKGLWSALGAGTSLAAAGVLALFSVSVLLGVNGWPQVRAADGGRVAVRAQALAPTAAEASTAAAPAVLPVPAAHRPRRTAGTGTRTGRRKGQANPGRRPAVQVSGPQASGPSSASGTPTSAAGPAPTPKPTPAAAAPQLPSSAGDAVTTVTGAAGDAVAPISPQVAGTVTQTGQQAADAIDQVGNTVGGVVGGLTGAPRP